MSDVATTVEGIVEQPAIDQLNKLTAKLDPALQAELDQVAIHTLRAVVLYFGPKLDAWVGGFVGKKA